MKAPLMRDILTPNRGPMATKPMTVGDIMAGICLLGIFLALGIVWPEPERVVSEYERQHGPGVVIQDIETGIECQIWPVPYASNQEPHRECKLMEGRT